MARPRLVVETGLYDGLATAVLLRALQRNEAEGDPGRLLGFDLEEESAWLVWDELGGGRFERHIGDAVELIPRALGGERIDFLVHDTDKVAESERAELELAIAHGAERLILYTDDDSVTGILRFDWIPATGFVWLWHPLRATVEKGTNPPWPSQNPVSLQRKNP